MAQPPRIIKDLVGFRVRWASATFTITDVIGNAFRHIPQPEKVKLVHTELKGDDATPLTLGDVIATCDFHARLAVHTRAAVIAGALVRPHLSTDSHEWPSYEHREYARHFRQIVGQLDIALSRELQVVTRALSYVWSWTAVGDPRAAPWWPSLYRHHPLVDMFADGLGHIFDPPAGTTDTTPYDADACALEFMTHVKSKLGMTFMRYVVEKLAIYTSCFGPAATRASECLRAYICERIAIDRSNLYNLVRERLGADTADHILTFTRAMAVESLPMRLNVPPEGTKPDGTPGQLVRTRR